MRNLLIITQKVDKNDQLLGFFNEWIKRFAGKFERVTVLCLEKGEFDLPENVKVFSLGKEKHIRNLQHSHVIRRFASLYTFYFLLSTLHNDYDAVFVHMNPVWVILGGPWWRLTGKKIFFWYTSGGITAKLKLAEKFADKIFTASKESFRVPSKKVIVTGHGIDTELFKPISTFRHFEVSKSLKILSVGRISPVKNYETLVEAAKILKDKGIVFSVTMVGEAPLRTDKNYELRIKDQVKDSGLEKYFNFVGKVDHKDLPEYYQSHDIFIHLSKTGSLDKTILEAMACGMKVLSSNDASRNFLAPELIFDQDNGKELADKIELSVGRLPDDRLRHYVIENHNLDKLIGKIFNGFVSESITVYPFPCLKKSNKYVSLLYSNIDGKVYDGAHFKVKDGNNFLKLLLSNSPRRSVVHIHWTNVIYGSRFLLKSLVLMAFNFALLSLLRTRGCRIVWTMHNYYSHDSRNRWADKLGRKVLFAMADAVTVHQKSEQMKLAAKHENKKVVFIPHGNYTDAYGPLSGNRDEMRQKFGFKENDIVLISIGAVKPYKKIESIVEAFNEFKAGANLPVKLLIAGKCDEGYAQQLKNLAGGSGHIKLVCDFIPDEKIPEYLAMADYSIFWYDDSVLTSGGIVLSLSYGVPVIVRNIPAADLVKNGENGFLFNDKRELVEIMAKLSDTPKFERDEIIATVKYLGWDKISNEFMRLYKSLWKS